MAKNNDSIEIFLHDLTPKKQQEIIDKLGHNGNYDVFPIATIVVEPEPDVDEMTEIIETSE